MLRRLLSFLPGFRTEYFTVIDDPADPTSKNKTSKKIESTDDIDLTKGIVKIKYFDLFGYSIGLRAFYRSPQE